MILAAGASAPPTALAAWSAWASVTPVAATRSTAGLARVSLPPLQIGPDADGNYPALRLVDDAGRDQPYAIDPDFPASDTRAVPLIDTGFIPHRGSQAVIDLGAGAALVDTLTLDVDVDVDSRPTYFERIAVDASDDRATWRVVRDNALLYRVAEDGGNGNQTISFPPTRSRWLRVRVLDAHAPLPLAGATVARAPQRAALLRLPLAARSNVDSRAHSQSWTFAAPVPIRAAALTFERAKGTFSRALRVETSDDGKIWSDCADETLARFDDGSAQLSFGLPETTARLLRVTVDNGNDAPLTRLAPVLFVREHELVFAAANGRRYWLLSSNPGAPPPAYDLADRLSHRRWSASAASSGATVANPAYRDPRPVGERYPWLLSSAVFAVALLLGGLSLRTIRRAAN